MARAERIGFGSHALSRRGAACPDHRRSTRCESRFFTGRLEGGKSFWVPDKEQKSKIKIFPPSRPCDLCSEREATGSDGPGKPRSAAEGVAPVALVQVQVRCRRS